VLGRQANAHFFQALELGHSSGSHAPRQDLALGRLQALISGGWIEVSTSIACPLRLGLPAMTAIAPIDGPDHKTPGPRLDPFAPLCPKDRGEVLWDIGGQGVRALSRSNRCLAVGAMPWRWRSGAHRVTEYMHNE